LGFSVVVAAAVFEMSVVAVVAVVAVVEMAVH
jgi:hypothetical protein